MERSREDQPLEDEIFLFRGFRLDGRERRLIDPEGRDVELTPKYLDALQVFASRPRRLISRDELIDAVWHDVAVTDSSLTQAISHLRRALDDQRRELIVTVPKAGYRFDVDVEQVARHGGGEAGSDPVPSESVPSEAVPSEPAPSEAVAAVSTPSGSEQVPTGTRQRSSWLFAGVLFALAGLSLLWWTARGPSPGVHRLAISLSPGDAPAWLEEAAERLLRAELEQRDWAHLEEPGAMSESPDRLDFSVSSGVV